MSYDEFFRHALGKGVGGGRGVAAVAAGRGWLRCAFLRRGGRCPCCAGRRRGLVQFMDKVVVLPVVVQDTGKVSLREPGFFWVLKIDV